ncbi:MAG: hypothetical protein K8T91_11560 [Planctomycetes bacterium]|nr:hypothetical protein [Planctomycetota bacterium]
MNPKRPESAGAHHPTPSLPNIDLASRLAYLGIEPQDAEALQSLVPSFHDFADRFVAAFYEHLSSFEPTAQFLQDPERLVRLKKAQREYFESLLRAQWNDEYVAQRHRIGQTHNDVGLAPEFFLGAYSLYVQHCDQSDSARYRPDLGRLFLTGHAKAAAGARHVLAGQRRFAPLRSTHFPRSQNSFGHRGQSVRRGAGRVRLANAGGGMQINSCGPRPHVSKQPDDRRTALIHAVDARSRRAGQRVAGRSAA